ncbi:MAG: hypothetical protein JSV88_17340 [Candidatus Aminicenantes bacterium]|nr:MAG: hypothetical protein JSV88_17340 [Candidatus Aminicenantes bacterium]
MQILDVSNPNVPQARGLYEHFGYLQYPLAVYVEGMYAYLTVHCGMIVLDISNPDQPVEIGQGTDFISSDFFNGDIKIAGDYA